MDKDDVRSRWDAALARLEQERDELALKIHLGKQDAVAEWGRLEAKWNEIRATKMPPMKEAAKEAAGGVSEALGLAVDELKKGYEKIRKLL